MNNYIITFDSSRCCGGESHVIVENMVSEEAALEAAEEHMHSAMVELFGDEEACVDEDGYEGGAFEDCPYTVISVEIFDEKHEHFKYRGDYYHPVL